MRQITYISIFFIIATAGISADRKVSRQVLLDEDFNTPSEDSFYAKALKHDLIKLAKGAGLDGSDAIKVAYVGYERGSKRVVVRYPLTEQVLEATLYYDVCFDKDFEWVIGGKLHGLGPKSPITGGKPRRPDGWSARITFKEDGHCATYLYDQDPVKTYGIGEKTPMPVFNAGQWHHVALEVKLNDPGKSNGHARIIIDGKVVMLSENIEFRGQGGAETEIQQFLFSTFHGGHSPKNAPVDEHGNPTTVYALFDNFRVVKGVFIP